MAKWVSRPDDVEWPGYGCGQSECQWNATTNRAPRDFDNRLYKETRHAKNALRTAITAGDGRTATVLSRKLALLLAGRIPVEDTTKKKLRNGRAIASAVTVGDRPGRFFWR